MSAAPVAKLSVKEYLDADRMSECRLEYHDGEVFPVEGATMAHAIIAANAAYCLAERLKGTRCRAAIAPLVRVSSTKFLYPDLAVICGKPVFGAEDDETITNPRLLVEVLSAKTSGYDHDQKFALYSLLPSFEEYVLIAQDRPTVKVFRKTPDGRWLLTIHESLNSVAKLESLDITVPLSDLYAGALPEESTAGN